MSFLARLTFQGRSVAVCGEGPVAQGVSERVTALGGKVLLLGAAEGDPADWTDQEVDGLVNVCGPVKVGPLDSVSPEDWDMVLRTQVLSAFRQSRKAMPAMAARRTGAIVNVAPTCGALRSAASSRGARAAIIGLTKALAREGAPLNVRANAVCPGLEATDPDEIEAGAIADAVAFLLSDAAAYVTGDTLTVGAQRPPGTTQGDKA